MDYRQVFATTIDLAEQPQPLHIVGLQLAVMRGEAPHGCIAVVEESILPLQEIMTHRSMRYDQELLMHAVLYCMTVILGLLLIRRIRPIPGTESCEPDVRVSVIIPARNEEKNLPRLLTSLKAQKYQPYEIIVVDDCSEDNTASIAEGFGVTLFRVGQKPEGWLGKSYACHLGASRASGEVFFFLDADCFFEPNGFALMVAAFKAGNGVLSAWPYHYTEKMYETLSFFFNSIITTNANRWPRKKNTDGVVLYGPAFLVSRKDYFSVGGHTSVKNEVLEDVVLGKAFLENGVPVRSLIGTGAISFRMYPQGIGSLVSGWIKSFSKGAISIPADSLAIMIIWITGLTALSLNSLSLIIDSISRHSLAVLGAPDAFLIWVSYVAVWLELHFLAAKTGRFNGFLVCCFFIPLFFFHIVFLVSTLARGVFKKVVWKGRVIDLRKKRN